MANRDAKDFKGKDFRAHPEHINKNGRGVSIKSAIKKLLKEDGEIKLPRKVVKEITNKYVILEIPRQHILALRLLTMAKEDGKDAFKALSFIVEMFDGKATQPISADFGEIREAIVKAFPEPEPEDQEEPPKKKRGRPRKNTSK